ncbi:MAG: class I SAM-dependent methyltransferase [Actinomycetota bacterium]
MVMQAREIAPAHLRSTCGSVIPLHVPRWFDRPGPEEEDVLALALPAALDVGCGPGRHTLALAARGVGCIGIDSAAGSVRMARRRGAAVLHRSIFDRLPDEGRWGSALLMDGNIGIGGDPRALLRRIGGLLRPGGRLLVELEAPGVAGRELRVQPDPHAGWLPWPPGTRFDWATVGVDDAVSLAAAAGFTLEQVWESGGRWFARMDATP